MKSIKIKLNHSNKEKISLLESLFVDLEKISEEYLKLRLEEIENNSYKSFKEHYAYFRSLYSNINSGILQYRLRNVDKCLKSYISWCKKKKKLVKYPENIKSDIPLRNDMFHFEYNKSTKEFNGWLKVLKKYFPLKLCKYHLDALKDVIRIGDSSIIKDSKGNYCLRLCFESKPKIYQADNSLGIDVGIVKPIVCSDGKQLGSGKYIKHKKIEFGKKRSRNQKKREEISKKQSNWTNDLNHKLSKQLIDYCISNNINVLSLEKLKGCHLSNRKRRKYSWAFKDLLNKITYKAQNNNIQVINVNPAYTSQTCSCCGLKEKSNRKNQSLYECSSCGSKMNADVNAAKNILNLSFQNGLNVNLTSGKALIHEAHGSLAHG
jgi:putative transposase